jgi:hypothetical protein
MPKQYEEALLLGSGSGIFAGKRGRGGGFGFWLLNFELLNLVLTTSDHANSESTRLTLHHCMHTSLKPKVQTQIGEW